MKTAHPDILPSVLTGLACHSLDELFLEERKSCSEANSASEEITQKTCHSEANNVRRPRPVLDQSSSAGQEVKEQEQECFEASLSGESFSRSEEKVTLKPNPLPFLPTDKTPGSAAKISVLQERVSKGQPLWHPEDSTLFDLRTLPGVEQFLALDSLDVDDEW